MFDLPKSLQSLIAEAKTAVERWDDDNGDSDSGGAVEAAKDWTSRLSRGEYDDDLYWECVAEDCEAIGDWDGAKAAYRKVLDLARSDIKGVQARHALAHLFYLMGDDRQALTHCHAASAQQRGKHSNIFYRSCLADEAWQLLRMGRVRAARKLVAQGLDSFDEDSVDYLNYARLHTVSAGCDIERGDTVAAATALDAAWDMLEALTDAHRDAGLEDEGSGVHAAYGVWWRTEAKRRRLAGEGEAEIEAWENSLDRARRGAVGWKRVGWHASIMRALFSLEESYERHGRFTQAVQARTEAEEIRRRWHLPEIDRTKSPDNRVFTVLRRLFRQRN